MRVTVTTRVELHDPVGRPVACVEAVQQEEVGDNPAFLLGDVEQQCAYAAQRVRAMVDADLVKRREVRAG